MTVKQFKEARVLISKMTTYDAHISARVLNVKHGLYMVMENVGDQTDWVAVQRGISDPSCASKEKALKRLDEARTVLRDVYELAVALEIVQQGRELGFFGRIYHDLRTKWYLRQMKRKHGVGLKPRELGTKATEQVCEECNQLPINCECESVIGTRWHDTKPGEF